MRIFVTALIVVLALTGSAFAGNVALSSLGATASCGGDSPCFLTYLGTAYVPANTIDGSLATTWVANGPTVDQYVLVTLNQPYTIDSVTIQGLGTPGDFQSFDVFVGGAGSTAASLLASTPVGTNNDQPDGTAWTDTYSVSTSSPIQYVLYENTGGTDYGSATEISADATVPEPGTFSLIGGAGMLLLGFARRRFQS